MWTEPLKKGGWTLISEEQTCYPLALMDGRTFRKQSQIDPEKKDNVILFKKSNQEDQNTNKWYYFGGLKRMDTIVFRSDVPHAAVDFPEVDSLSYDEKIAWNRESYETRFLIFGLP